MYTFINTNQALVFFNRQNLSSLSGWARGDESYTFSVINGMCDFLNYMYIYDMNIGTTWLWYEAISYKKDQSLAGPPFHSIA